MQRLAGRIGLLRGWRRASAAFLAGLLAVAGQAPYDFPLVCLISFPVLVWLLDGTHGRGAARFRQAFATGWWFGFGYFLGGLWWIGLALLVEAESFAWALPFAMVGIPLLLAFFYGFAAVLARLMWCEGIGRIAALAVGFAVAEWLRGFVLTGFPWNSIGYAAMPVPMLMQSVALVGMDGMNALAVFVFALPALLDGAPGRRLGAALFSGLLILHAGFGYYRLAQPLPAGRQQLSVRIVQPDIDLSEKWDEGVRERIFATLIELSARPPAPGQARPQLIVWPETSVPFLFSDRPDALEAIGGMLQEGQMLLAGIVREERAPGPEGRLRYYNTVAAIDDGGRIVAAVDKVHLVPFGEYIPFSGLFGALGIEQLVAGPMNFTAGKRRSDIVLPGGVKAVPFICYEAIFPELVAHDAAAGQVMVNVTNDAWFGDTAGPYQHFRQAQLRSVENGLPLLRAANTGISGIVEQRGVVIDALAMNRVGVIDARIPLYRSQAVSPKQRRINSLLLLALATVALAAKMRRRLPSSRLPSN